MNLISNIQRWILTQLDAVILPKISQIERQRSLFSKIEDENLYQSFSLNWTLVTLGTIAFLYLVQATQCALLGSPIALFVFTPFYIFQALVSFGLILLMLRLVWFLRPVLLLFLYKSTGVFFKIYPMEIKERIDEIKNKVSSKISQLNDVVASPSRSGEEVEDLKSLIQGELEVLELEVLALEHEYHLIGSSILILFLMITVIISLKVTDSYFLNSESRIFYNLGVILPLMVFASRMRAKYDPDIFTLRELFKGNITVICFVVFFGLYLSPTIGRMSLRSLPKAVVVSPEGDEYEGIILGDAIFDLKKGLLRRSDGTSFKLKSRIIL